MAFNPAHLFDKPDFSDVIISYSGRKTFCHKIIICQSSEYLMKLCGPGSHFAESKQTTIELKEDDADAVFHLLRYVYTKDHHCGNRESDWAYQIKISEVARKYLYHELHTIARNKALVLLNALTDPKKIARAISQMRHTSGDIQHARAVTESLQDQNILALLDQPEFREIIEQDTSEMWNVMTQLADFKAQFKVDLCKMRLMWCESCGDGKIYPFNGTNGLTTYHQSQFDTDTHKVLSVECWMPKAYEEVVGMFNERTGTDDI